VLKDIVETLMWGVEVNKLSLLNHLKEDKDIVDGINCLVYLGTTLF
jgi:hypothetical protein